MHLSSKEIDNICKSGCQTMIKSIKAVPDKTINVNQWPFDSQELNACQQENKH
jgi:hypothetical protein